MSEKTREEKIIKLKREVLQLQNKMNLEQCPECGGLHQCRLYCDNEGNINIITYKGLIDPCWGYINELHRCVDELKVSISI